MVHIKLFNYLSRKTEVFRPLKSGRVGLYTCGPTVYNYVHIGNLRTYIFGDVLRRMLEYAGLKVKHIMNLTDVDDKTIEGARAAGKNLKDFTKFYKGAFLKDVKKLNIYPPLKYSAATDHVRDMIRLISTLLKKRLAYQTSDGVFFDISKFKKYGRLSQLKKREIKIGARVASDEYEKGSAEDFALWKAPKPGEPFWNSPFGKGRPGWHIECSAMSMKYLGKSFDIHAGGVDLLFPHHENEIAQSEGATGKRFVKYFVEGEHLLVNGRKMSKSLGNVYTLDALEKRGFNPLAFRYLAFTAHYRSQLNFTWESLEAAQNSLERLWDFVRMLKTFMSSLTSPPNPLSLRRRGGKDRDSISLLGVRSNFNSAIFDDLDTPKALAVLWDLVHEYHKHHQKHDPKAVFKLLYDFDRVLGLDLAKVKTTSPPSEITNLVKEREEARRVLNFEAADALRKKVRSLGWEIQDTKEGPKLKKLK